MTKLSILVVEDDPLARKTMAMHLDGHVVDFAGDKAEARAKLETGRPDVCFIDLQLGAEGDCSGLDIIPECASKGICAVVMSGHDSESFVERAYALGCNDFYAKGNEESNVSRILARCMGRKEASETERLFTERFITQDAATRASVSEALKYAASELPILILGPSGTGKSSLAKIIHERSGRPGQFVSLNCACNPEDLLEAELFGYRKGAFTGASENRKGKLLLADRGTLFLDEIGSMSLQMQAKLLKAVEEKSFYPLGSESPEVSDFQVISATLEDPQKLIERGKLRFDFFQRIRGAVIELKPLAERRSDIFSLLTFFTRGGKRLSFTPEAKDQLLAYEWPGNARELDKFVTLLVAGHEGRVDLETVNRLLAAVRVDESEALVTEKQYRFARSKGLHTLWDRISSEAISRSLTDNQENKTKVLQELKISSRRLYGSLKKGKSKLLKPRGS